MKKAQKSSPGGTAAVDDQSGTNSKPVGVSKTLILQIKSMEDFSTSSEFSFVKNLTPRMYAANPAYKTNKAKLMEVDARRAHSENFPRWKNTLCYSKRYGTIEYFDFEK